jgi:outer membrane lipoprotein-sorting protein
MPFRRLIASVAVLCLSAAGLSSCLARRRVITRSGGKVTQTLLISDVQTLLDGIDRQYHAVDSFSATVDMVPALGSAEKSRITEYKDVRAYIVFRKPSHIRLIGLLPVVRNKAFDMVSDVVSFKLHVPSKARFIVGPNEITTLSPNKIENLRPQHFLEALLVRPVDLKTDKPMLENYTDEDNAAYILHLVRQDDKGNLRLSRTVWFNRLNLRIARQIICDDAGNILTDARYSEWQNYDGVPFPKHIEINRPRDEYAVVITVVKMDINKGIGDEKFVLEQPEGTTLQTVGPTPPPAKAPAAPTNKGKTRKK